MRSSRATRWTAWLAAGVIALMAVALQACGPLPRLQPVPQAKQDEMTVLGLKGAWFWGDEVTPQLIADGLAAYRRERDYATAMGHTGPLPPAYYLAVSGGGENGAFGAGLLVGWTASGTRPSCKIVTGISTGALIAPFAFLGPAYDAQLRQVYTETESEEILERRFILTGLLGDGLSTNQPLYRTIQRFVTPAFIQAIAQEYQRGRLLLIGTTDLDAGRPIIWDIGKIAASGRPGSVTLIHKVILASAAIPVAFPPVMIDVEAGGRRYQEMNVDGGASSQVFVYPPGLRINQFGIARERHLYVIRNGRLHPEWGEVNRQTLSIANRSTAALILTQGMGDLYRIFGVASRDDVDFNLASMPASFDVKSRYPFDPEYMRSLFQTGYALGKAGYPWAKYPPGYCSAPTTTDPRPQTASEKAVSNSRVNAANVTARFVHE